MERHELEFQLAYSIIMEEMQQTLMRRIDQFCTFAQLVLGAATFSAMVDVKLSGAAVAVLAALQVVYQPSAKAMEAKIQRKRYLDIKALAQNLSDTELSEKLTVAGMEDSAVLGSLTHPAWLATCRQLGIPVPVETRPANFKELVVSFLGGY